MGRRWRIAATVAALSQHRGSLAVAGTAVISAASVIPVTAARAHRAKECQQIC